MLTISTRRFRSWRWGSVPGDEPTNLSLQSQISREEDLDLAHGRFSIRLSRTCDSSKKCSSQKTGNVGASFFHPGQTSVEFMSNDSGLLTELHLVEIKFVKMGLFKRAPWLSFHYGTTETLKSVFDGREVWIWVDSQKQTTLRLAQLKCFIRFLQCWWCCHDELA